MTWRLFLAGVPCGMGVSSSPGKHKPSQRHDGKSKGKVVDRSKVKGERPRWWKGKVQNGMGEGGVTWGQLYNVIMQELGIAGRPSQRAKFKYVKGHEMFKDTSPDGMISM